MRAKKEGDYYILNGTKTFITNGIYGHFVILVCKTNPDAGSAGVSLILVDLSTEGITKNKLKKLGWHASDTAELHFDNVRVPAKNLLGEEGKGFYYLMGGLQLERLAGSIMGYASCEEILSYSMQYMNERSAFGRTINKFQVLRHRVAQLAAEIECVKTFVLTTAKQHTEGKYVVKECSMAKLLSTELADKCMYQCVQFFGGYGFMEEYKVARAYRDSRIGTIGGGTSEIMREIIAKMVMDDINYKSSVARQPAEEANQFNTVADIFSTLPSRFKSEKAKGKKLNVAFNFDHANYFVLIDDGKLDIQSGVPNIAEAVNCTVETDDATYIAVETGKLNPQEAFMTGKIKVSDIMSMMEFGGLFKKLT